MKIFGLKCVETQSVELTNSEIVLNPLENLVEDLIVELKRMNTQLALVTGEEVKEEDA